MNEQEVADWLVDCIAAATGLSRDEIDRSGTFAEHGLGSRDAVRLASELERKVGCRISPTIAWDLPTIDAVARYVARAPSIADRGTRS